ncbi:hypothetical protein TNCV_3240001 [Trichonephila clavipes]|nr:hypothetical protein TNCV_3240001 [Trichonephila clavipes]
MSLTQALLKTQRVEEPIHVKSAKAQTSSRWYSLKFGRLTRTTPAQTFFSLNFHILPTGGFWGLADLWYPTTFGLID